MGEPEPQTTQDRHTPDEILAQATERLIDATIIHYASEHGFHDPTNALHLADRDTITVDEHGDVHGVEDAVRAVAQKSPYLLDRGQPRFVVPGDGGQHSTHVHSLNRSDLQQMSPAEINQARRDGQLDTLLRGGRW